MQEPEPEPKLKKCPYCGRMTSAEANFCWWCARELVARPERPMEEPRPSRVNWVLVGLVVLGVIVVVLLVAR